LLIRTDEQKKDNRGGQNSGSKAVIRTDDGKFATETNMLKEQDLV
jgi:hypothetical protein